jgi:hypothetical protein
VRGVGGVPCVVEGCEGGGGVLGAEEEVALCFVGFEVCITNLISTCPHSYVVGESRGRENIPSA